MISAIRSPASRVYSRIYEKLIWDTLRASRFESIAELVEEVKTRCARLGLEYRHHEIDRALATMGDKVTREIHDPKPAPAVVAPSPRPLTRAEAAEWVRRLGATPRAVRS